MTKTNVFSWSNRRRLVEHRSATMAIRSYPVVQATTTRSSHSNTWAIRDRTRTNCTHFSNLKPKMTILIAPDGKGKTSVWLSGRRGDMWEPPLIVGFHNRFDVPVLLLRMSCIGVLESILQVLLIMSTPGSNLSQLNKELLLEWHKKTEECRFNMS